MTQKKKTARGTRLTDAAGILLLVGLPALAPIVALLWSEPQPGLAALGGLSGCLVVGCALARRKIGWEVIAPACLLLLGLVLGRIGGASEAAAHVTSHKLFGITARADSIAKLISTASESFALAATCASATFALEALVVGIAARARLRGEEEAAAGNNRRRILVLIVTLVLFGAIALAVIKMHVGSDGEYALFAGVPATVSVLGIFLAGAGSRSDVESTRTEACADVVRATLLGTVAIACAIIAISHFDIRVSTYNAGVGDLARDAVARMSKSTRRASLASPFFIPVLLPAVIFLLVRTGTTTSTTAWTMIRAHLLRAGRPIAASSIGTLFIAAVGVYSTRSDLSAILAVDVANVPRDIKLAEMQRPRYGCDNVSDDDILWITKESVIIGKTTIGQTTRLDSTEQCVDLLSKRKVDAIGIDESVTHGRLLCVLEALVTGEGRQIPWIYRAASEDRPGTSCVEVTLEGSTYPSANVMQLSIADDPMHKPTSATMGWAVSNALLDVRDAPNGFTSDQLSTMALDIWKAQGSPTGDRALVDAPPTTSIGTIAMAMSALMTPSRESRIADAKEQPAFSIAFSRGDREIKSPSMIADAKADLNANAVGLIGKRTQTSIQGAIEMCFLAACSTPKKKELLVEQATLASTTGNFERDSTYRDQAITDLRLVKELDPDPEASDDPTPVGPKLLALLNSDSGPRTKPVGAMTIAIASDPKAPLRATEDIDPIIRAPSSLNAIRTCHRYRTKGFGYAADFDVPFEIDARGFVWPSSSSGSSRSTTTTWTAPLTPGRKTDDAMNACVVGVLGTLRFAPATRFTRALLTLGFADPDVKK